MRVVVFAVTLLLLQATRLQAQISPVSGLPGTETVANLAASVQSSNLEFVPNLGQLSDKHGNPVQDVLYASNYRGLTIYFAAREMHFYFTRAIRQPDKPRGRLDPPMPHDPRNDTMFTYRVDLKFIGANPNPQIIPQEKQGDFSNYYIPRFPNGLTDVPAYGSLLYKDLYPDIDMRIYSTADGMKYDFVVRPGGDPSKIRMHYDGPDSVLSKNGVITAYTPFGTLQEEPPLSYQENPNPIKQTADSLTVGSHFILSGSDLTFSIGSYNPELPLVIDPPRLWGTYFGSYYTVFYGLAVDQSDNIIASGSTYYDLALGTAGTYQDTINHASGYYWNGIIAKFSPTGSRLWCTYFGGGLTDGYTVAVDPSSNIIMEGFTWDDTCIASPGAFQTVLNNQVGDFAWDGYIAKFDSSGHRDWSTYFGTSDTDYIYQVAVDSSSNIYVDGYTSSTSGIASPGAWKTSRVRTAPDDYGGFLAKFSPSGNRLWSTYVGDTVTQLLGVCIVDGSSPVVSGLTVCKAGIATSGVYQPTIPNYVAGILMKFNATGQRVWGTYIDGVTNASYFGTEIYRVACVPGGNIYTTGVTWNPSGLGTPGAYRTSITYGHDASILETFDGTGNRLAGTYYGDSWRSEVGYCLAVTPDGAPVVGGWTTDSFHIATTGALDSVVDDTDVSFLARFTPNCALKWGTYFSGSPHIGEYWDVIYGTAVDRRAHPIIAGLTGSSGGIATTGAFQTAYAGYLDGYVVKFCDTLRTPLSLTTDTSSCFGVTDTATVAGGYAGYQWRQNGTTISGATSRRYVIPSNEPPGNYRFTVDISDPNICTYLSDTIRLLVRTPPTIHAGSGKTICLNSGAQIGDTATGTVGPYHYAWVPGSGLSDSLTAKPIASPKKTTMYTVIVTDANGCQNQDSVLVVVNSLPQVNATRNVVLCLGASSQIGAVASGGLGPYTYAWDPPTGLNATNIPTPIASPTQSTDYHVHVTDANGCDSWDTVSVIFVAPPDANILQSSPVAICQGDSTILDAPPGLASYLWSDGERSRSIWIKNPGSYYVQVSDLSGCTGYSDTVIAVIVNGTVPSISGPNSACPQSTAEYIARKDSAAQYSWTISGGGTIASGTGTNDITVNWTTAGSWTLSVQETSTLGCTKDTATTVTVGSTLVPTITPPGPVTLCNGDTTILRAASGFQSYAWSSGGTADSIVVIKSGSYTVTVTGQGGCSGTSVATVVNVSPTPKPHPVIAASATTICAGDVATLSTIATYSGYQWSTGATTPSIQVTQTGEYHIVVTDSNGCMGVSDSVLITVQPLPKVSITANAPQPITLCSGDSVTLTATAGGVTYLWSTGDTTRTITVFSAGTYSVHMIDSHGCSATSASVSVDTYTSHSATLKGPGVACTNSEVLYVVDTGKVSTTWSVTGGTLISGQSTDTITVLWSTKGIGHIQVDEVDLQTGCKYQLGFDVSVDDSLVPVIKASGPLTFCQGDSVVLDAGVGFATYQWMLNGTDLTNETNETVTAKASGQYSVFVTNSGSCHGTSKPDTVAVNAIPLAPVISQIASTLFSTPAKSYQWSMNGTPISGATLDSLLTTQSGSYAVTIFDANGCSNTSQPFPVVDSNTTTIAIPTTLTANPGDTLSMPVELLNSQRLAQSGAMHYTAKIRFNSTMLVPRGVTPVGVMQGNDEIVTVSGMNPLPLGTTTGTLATLNFLATLGNDTCTDVSIDEFIWTDGNVSVTRQNGQFCLTGICKAGGTYRLIDPNAKLSLSLSHPNPATSSASVDYDLDEQGETDLFITDMLGREVKHIVNGIQLPGHYTANFDLKGLAQGSYIYVLKTPTAKLSHMLQVLR